MRVKTIAVLTLLWVVMQIITNVAMGQYLDEQLETNINKVDPLFEQNVPKLKEFKTGIEQDKKVLAEQIGQNMMPPIADSGKIANERARLESLDALELDSIARREIAKDPFHNEMFVDLSRPGMQAHLEDAKKIARGSSKMIEGIIANLKDLGVDCKTVKGNIEKDPEYFMEFKKEVDNDSKDTIYDQFFCERLRNHYSCSSSLSMKCVLEGKQWGQWQDRDIDISGEEICRQHYTWLRAVFWKKKRYGMHMREDAATQQDVRRVIAEKLSVELDQIGEAVGISARGEGALTECRRHEVKWDSYHFKYRYRNWHRICVQWQERWDEICKLRN